MIRPPSSTLRKPRPWMIGKSSIGQFSFERSAASAVGAAHGEGDAGQRRVHRVGGRDQPVAGEHEAGHAPHPRVGVADAGAVVGRAHADGAHVVQRAAGRHDLRHPVDELAQRGGGPGLVLARPLEVRLLQVGELVGDPDARQAVLVGPVVLEGQPVLRTRPLADPPAHADVAGRVVPEPAALGQRRRRDRAEHHLGGVGVPLLVEGDGDDGPDRVHRTGRLLPGRAGRRDARPPRRTAAGAR